MRGPTDPQRRTSPVAGTNRRPAPPTSLPGVAGFKSERWPTSNRNGGPASGRKGGRHQIGKGGRLASESAPTEIWRSDQTDIRYSAPSRNFGRFL